MMPCNLIYFHPPDIFKVKVKVTETLIFWSKFEILLIFVNEFTYLGYSEVAFIEPLTHIMVIFLRHNIC